jgi:acetyltransferase-like isoleucine patch superfamily enzyme
MNILKKIITLLICFLFPIKLTFWILNLMGHKVHHKSKIGFSLLWIKEKLTLDDSCRIGNFNLIKLNNLTIKKLGYISNFNKLNGPIEIILQEKAAIGNNNNIYRSPLGITYDKSILQLGILSKITGNHRIDSTRNIMIGNYSTIAGHDSQLWTHAYYHDKKGPGRFRLDGDIEIGDNVYIGSRCVITGGVKIADNIVVGANACVSKSLLIAGIYVNQPLRFIEPIQDARANENLTRIERFPVSEEVYEKRQKN